MAKLFRCMLQIVDIERKMSTSSSHFSIANQLLYVNDKIKAASVKRPQHLQYSTPRLVAVSKTKGTDLIIEAYDAGQRHFGENYVVELHEKANDIEIQDRCQDIQWHFIGHLQRNKISKILDVPNLFVIETVDSEKLAKALSDSWGKLKKSGHLQVMAQINTSGETSKSGCSPSEAVQLVKYIKEHCPHLQLLGLMTIGSFDHDINSGPNPDFQALFDIRKEVCQSLNILEKDLELSMGMSADFEHAIEMGSTNVRVGSTIFGERRGHQEKGTASDQSVQTDQNRETNDVQSSLNKIESLALT
ncbi:pyridoxal phosphate homeostasis protein-like isoform X1 [Biomphalaria glabrata]|uniref:Pyridoxal phosphate homeostasis protein n=2 Tax=Biomphalaria glabrata TaxID=6526 RepID=A0A9W2YPM9_BIOGL|nr:pyridoxal phosphate homeostasis protein-like isoform X1 [Biomphalaria glabrata]